VNDRISKWRKSLERTRRSTFGRIANLVGVSEINHDTWDELEELLVQADLGIASAMSIVADLQSLARTHGWTRAEEVQEGIRQILRNRLVNPGKLQFNPNGPTVVLIVGVNGSGKTTTTAKLGARYKQEGKQVSLAAADTFRAAAREQLQSWGDRLGLRVIAGQPEGDPAAITYDAVQSAIAHQDDLLLVDTAGRMHTRYNLMEELKKVHRVAGKALEDAPHAVWLVMDATTGQNALQQAKAFKDAVQVSGVILAKLDSSARGGMAFAIHEVLELPILFAGLGETPEDLSFFDPSAFVESILADFE